jgi:hypothetical protein
VTDKGTIFVSIASFCDPYLRFTIESAMTQAAQPNHVVLGVVDQGRESLSGWLSEQAYSDQVRYLQLDPLHSRGVCWARHLVQSLFDGEALFLQVDSHTCFQPGWDAILHEHLDRLSQISSKPVLSIYPPGFEFDDEGKPVARTDLGANVGSFRPKPDQLLREDDRVLKFKAVSHRAPAEATGAVETCWHYARGAHLAGGFLATLGEFVHEVPYDPNFYFHGEEQGLALRAFTHGWDVFHPQFNRVPLRHLYKTPESTSPNLHWRQDLEAKRPVKWSERRASARQRLNDLIAGRLEAPYGLGNQRSLSEFIAVSGLDYLTNQILEPRVEFVSLPTSAS